MPLEDFTGWLKRPASKQDLLALGIALWLLDSGKGEDALDAVRDKVRGLLGAAKADKPEEAKPEGKP